MKQKYRGFRIGALNLLSPTNNPHLFNIASWHNVRSVTWRWILSVYFRRPSVRPHFNFYSNRGPHWNRKYGFGTLWTGFNWGLSLGIGTTLYLRISHRDASFSLLGAELCLTMQRPIWRY